MDLVIRGGSLFDPRTLDVRRDVVIEIRGGIVHRVSTPAQSQHPKGQVVDAAGCTIIPGLFNLHSHPQRRHARHMGPRSPFRVGAAAVEALPNTQRLLYAIQNSWQELIDEGVTTIRAAGSKDYLNIELRDVFAEGVFDGPRIIATGPILAITGGHGTRGLDGGMEVDGADNVRRVVRGVLKAGADWIKLCVSGGLAGIHKGDHPSIVEFTPEEVQAAVYEAHKRGRKVMVHGMAAESVKMAVQAGVDCIEHGNLLDEKAMDMMSERAVSFVPTMSGIRKVYERERDGGSLQVAEMLREVIEPQADVVRECIRRGILIGTGTDTLGAISDEIQMLATCGMSNAEALAAATLQSARIVEMEDRVGIIEEGKVADLVLLEEDPTQDLGALKRIREVISKGNRVSWQHLACSRAKRAEKEE